MADQAGRQVREWKSDDELRHGAEQFSLFILSHGERREGEANESESESWGAD